MARIHIIDQAHTCRIKIDGRFAGDLVKQVERCWRSALLDEPCRTFVIDISHVTGYDNTAAQLIREMQLHGTTIAASNPRALSFLNEISSQRVGPTLVYRSERDFSAEARPKPASTPLLAHRAAAAGQ